MRICFKIKTDNNRATEIINSINKNVLVNLNENEEKNLDVYIEEGEEYIEINGSLKCHSAGTMEDPFDRYDITITLW